MNDDFSDAYVMAAFGRMASAAKEKETLDTEATELQVLIGIRQAATQVICGSILQIAKQGISVVHGGSSSAPEGRAIGSTNVRDIVWAGRNQSLHYEEPPKLPTRNLFAILEKEQGTQFSLATHVGQNRAAQIIKLLGWTSYAAYLADMTVILP